MRQAVESEGFRPTPAQLEALTSRLLASSALRRSGRLSELLLYVVDRTAAGAVDDLREQTIGVRVFGRVDGYDTASDNIVRVSMHTLRLKLDEYFATEGLADPLRISIPKGAYRAEFHSLALALPPVHQQEPWVSAERTVADSFRRFDVQKFGFGLLCLTLLLALGIGAVMTTDWRTLNSVANRALDTNRFWSEAAGAQKTLLIIPADSGFSLLQDSLKLDLGLEDYLALRVGGRQQHGAQWPELTQRLHRRDYTSVTDSRLLLRLGGICNALALRCTVQSAGATSLQNLKVNNIVLLGSARSNPWVSLLDGQVNFQLEYSASPPWVRVRNRHPREGEATEWQVTAHAGDPGVAMGIVSFMPNLDASGHIISIAGTSMEGTEAAAEVLLNNSTFMQLVRQSSTNWDKGFPYFEVLVRAHSIGGSILAPEIMGLRVGLENHGDGKL